MTVRLALRRNSRILATGQFVDRVKPKGGSRRVAQIRRNAMKVRFTLLQIIVATVSIFALCVCAAADCFLIYLNIVEVNSNSFVINGIVSLAAAIILALLILKPSLTNVVRKNDDENPAPALSAVRTYLCFIALDAAAILSITLLGAVFEKDVVMYIIIVAPLLFIVGVVKYLFDVRRIGVDDSVDEDDSNE